MPKGSTSPARRGRRSTSSWWSLRYFRRRTPRGFWAASSSSQTPTDRLEGRKAAASTVLRGVNKALHAVGINSPTASSLGGAPNVNSLGVTCYSLTLSAVSGHLPV